MQARGQELAFLQKLQPRVDAAAAALQSSLDATLAATLAAQAPAALFTCLHAYAAIGRPAAAEAVVRAQLVAPAVREALLQGSDGGGGATGGAGVPSAAATASSSQQLPAALRRVQAGLSAAASPFLEHVLSQPSVAAPFELLGGAVLAEVRGGHGAPLVIKCLGSTC